MIQCIECKSIDLEISEHKDGEKCQCIITPDMKTGGKPKHLSVKCNKCKHKWAFIPNEWYLQELDEGLEPK